VIFSGTVLAGGNRSNAVPVRFKVDRAFKGVQSGSTIELDTAAGTTCAASFQIRRKYLVYAGRTNGRIWTTACKRSQPESNATQDLEYLAAWQQDMTSTQIVGTVVLNAPGDGSDQRRYESKFASATVRIVGTDGKASQIGVNSHGEFVAAVPVAGRYKVSVSLPGWFGSRSEETVLVPERGCGDVWFSLRPDGQVKGQALEFDGKPAQNVLMKLAPVEGVSVDPEVRTDDKGWFHFRGVLANSYRLGVNIGNMDDPTPKAPFPPTFYPGVPNEVQAGVVRMRDFETVQLRPFRLPSRLVPGVVRVFVALGDGRPVVGASVSCTPAGRPYWRKDLTNERGEIEFQAMSGLAYIVDVDIPSYHELAKSGYERSQWVRVQPGRGTTDVRLVFRKKQ